MSTQGTSPTDVLLLAITKAAKNGWDETELSPANGFNVIHPVSSYRTLVEIHYADAIGPRTATVDYQAVIFNHDFAKALWGKTVWESDEGSVSENPKATLEEDWQDDVMGKWDFQLPAWAYHLMMMVIADDPIQYLGEHL